MANFEIREEEEGKLIFYILCTRAVLCGSARGLSIAIPILPMDFLRLISATSIHAAKLAKEAGKSEREEELIRLASQLQELATKTDELKNQLND